MARARRDLTGPLSRRGFLAAVGVGGAVVLVGCASAGAPAGPSADPGATRPVDHAMGRTDVPETPQRVACANTVIQEDAIALGLPVVAGVAANLTGEIPQYVRERLAPDFVEMGRENQVTVEGVLGLRPDLLLGNENTFDETYDQYSQVAPTVAVPALELGQQAWVQRMEFLAAAAGVPERVGPAVDAYRQRAAGLAARLPRPTPTITVARIFVDEFEYRTLDGSFPWSVLREVGLQPPPQQDPGDVDTAQVKLGLEEARQLDADVLVLAVDGVDESGESGNDLLAQLEQSPLWNRVQGRRVQIDSNEFVFGGLLTAENILDLVENEILV